MANGDLNWIANFLWGIADDVLRDLFVRGKYRDVILPMTVQRTALDGITSYAGLTRPAGVEIGGSQHQPPGAHLVPELLEQNGLSAKQSDACRMEL